MRAAFLLCIALSGCLIAPQTEVTAAEPALQVVEAGLDIGDAYGKTLVFDVPPGQWAMTTVTLGPKFWDAQGGTGRTEYQLSNGVLGVVRDGEIGLLPMTGLSGAYTLWDDGEEPGLQIVFIAEGDEDGKAYLSVGGEGTYLDDPVANITTIDSGARLLAGGAFRIWIGDAYGWIGGGEIYAEDHYTEAVTVGGTVITPHRTTDAGGYGTLDAPGVVATYVHFEELTGVGAWTLDVQAGGEDYTWAGPDNTAATGDAPAPASGPTFAVALPATAGTVSVAFEQDFSGTALHDAAGAGDYPIAALSWAAFDVDLDAHGWTLRDMQFGPIADPL